MNAMCAATVSRFPEKRRGRQHVIDEQCSATSIMCSDETAARAVQTTVSTMCAATVSRFPEKRRGRLHVIDE